jgi:hypothetical protein
MNHGWFDHDAHKSETCVSCHRADISNNATDLLLPDMASCRTCHVGGNGDTLKPVKTPVESSCAMCHDYHFDAFAPWRTKLQVEKGKGRPRFSAKAAAAQ